MAKITKRQWELVKAEYDKWLERVAGELIDFRDKLKKVMNESDLKTFRSDDDFTNFGKEAIFYKLNIFHDEEAAVNEVNNLLVITDDDIEDA